ncbi:hypothetical protein J2X02_001375 [Pseudoxanthomonas japonensis]|uniref:hypothetical protein n=1 Tax=Pseudoxanthomonas japonensis TaxID=69284 RepID=UPI002867A95A|nr:hypothetical protein [Pseudoxanthomonas japonensis]MDR7068558.1 hypothetical protein [Pseudoxanthomonas japonensis]
MNRRHASGVPMRTRQFVSACAAAWLLLTLAACSPGRDQAPVAAPAGIAMPEAVDARKCIDEPRTDERDERPRCEGMAAAPPAPQAYRVVGGSGDPVDQRVCDINETFVLDGRRFGVEYTGGMDGTYRFVRTPDMPGLRWTAGGRYHIEFPDGVDRPGTMTTEGGGTTTAGATSRATTGGERFTLTPVETCTP